jgi:hypothetical protein
MSRPVARAVLIVALAVAALARVADVATADVSVTFDRDDVATRLGHRFTVRSTIANPGPGEARGLIAHLNVLSLRDGVYVDPEDWSTGRTRYLASIPPGGSATVTWRLQAVSAGSFAVYVAVLAADAAGAPAVGPAVRVAVSERRSLDAAGILPLALTVPALIAAAAVALRARRRHAVR